MNHEISIASKYIVSLLIASSNDARDAAIESLQRSLQARFANHFDLANPLKGSGYRCLHVNFGVPEPLIANAIAAANCKLDVSAAILRDELALFCDPGYVSVKISGRETVLYNVEDVQSADRMSLSSPPLSPMRSLSLSPDVASNCDTDVKQLQQQHVAPLSPPRSPIRDIALSAFAPVFQAPQSNPSPVTVSV
jgi:hypothetical protein